MAAGQQPWSILHSILGGGEEEWIAQTNFYCIVGQNISVSSQSCVVFSYNFSIANNS